MGEIIDRMAQDTESHEPKDTRTTSISREMCEFVKKAFEQAMEEVAELPEIPPAEQVRIAMNYGEVKRHEKKD